MGFQSRYTHNFSFYIFLVVIIASLTISFKINTLLETIILAFVSIVLILLTRTAWEPAHRGTTTVRLRSLQIAISVVSLQPWWKTVFNSVSKPFLNKLPPPLNSPESPSIAVLIFIAFVIFIVNHYTQDKTAMGKHPTPIEKEFPEKTYRDRLKAFCNYFADDIRKTDRENRWNPDAYIPLEAEVEVQSGTKKLRKVTDLLNGIRSDKKTRVFLVLGDPGSGKSVALRKLCLELFLESERTGKVPLYINLKEWKPERVWTEDNPPTVDELHHFVFKNLHGRGDYYTNEFMRAAFDKMLLHGRFFIILDSFDEIPAVLDEQENSWLIDKLSDITHRFLCGATESRGLLASRFFRKPTSKFDAKTTLEIRPLTENKIINLLKKSLSYNETLVKLIFKDRQEFVPVARNPFTANLISSYAQSNSNNLPQNQAELYASYIEQNLDASMDKIKKNKLTKEEITQCAADISDVMLTTETLGLEAPISELSTRLPNYPVEKVIGILKYARLGRLGSGDEQQFSFVHRRFNEYFVVKRLLEQPERVPKDAIPTDSRWRDALVLYCEVAQEDEVKQIANFCWVEINQIVEDGLDIRDPRFLRMIHCLRFIKEAFRARLSSIEDFRENLAVLVHQILKNKNQNILLQKIVVDAVGLLRDEDIDVAIIQALSIGDSWIKETALRSCRHLPKISNNLKYGIICYIDSYNFLRLFKQKDDLLFSLSLSDGFTEVRNFLRWRIIDMYLFAIGFVILFLLNPITIVVVTVSLFTLLYLKKYLVGDVQQQNIFDVQQQNIFNNFFSKFFSKFLYEEERLIVINSNRFAISFALSYGVLINTYLNLYTLINYTHLEALSEYLKLINLLIIPLILPIYYIPLNIKLLFKRINHFFAADYKFKIKTLFKLLLKLFIIIAIPVLFMFSVFVFFSARNYILTSIIGGIYIIISIILYIRILSSLSRTISNHIYDWHNLRREDKTNYTSREDIDRKLKVFKTPRGRMEYVKFLQRENIKPTGNWLTNNLPNYKDEASSLLARLEEKWLGLNR